MRHFILIVIILFSCEYADAPNIDSNYLVFGHFYGFCLGEKCVEIFKLTGTGLYEDRLDKYPLQNKPYEGEFEMLSNTLFEKVKSFPSQIPQELLNTPSGVIGQPDAGDWGGLYFEVVKSSSRQFWLIDKMKTNLPEYLRPFATEIEQKIELINN